jgi:hypothetical protein
MISQGTRELRRRVSNLFAAAWYIQTRDNSFVVFVVGEPVVRTVYILS